jgi:ankyrin repeat protein
LYFCLTDFASCEDSDPVALPLAIEFVRCANDRGADIDAVSKNKFSATPLQGAAAMQNLELARL